MAADPPADPPADPSADPLAPGATGLALALRLALATPALVLYALALLPLWVPYLLLAALYGRPPNVPRGAQIARYLHAAWTVDPPAPGLSPGQRAWLTLLVLRKVATIPVWGLAWLLDEVLYGRRLAATPVRAPLLEISAARSGSTQLARYLEDDPALVAPSFLQCTFPYLWAWRLAPPTIGRILTPDRVRHLFERLLPEAFRERHEGDPFRTDTFEASLYLAHLNHLSLFYGPTFGAAEFGLGVLHAGNRTLWEEDFVALLDGIGRKTLLYAGPQADGRPRRLLVKGHFLAGAPALAARYPDARFLCMLRAPDKRLRSAVNYLRANPFDATLGPPPWPWLGATLAVTEPAYCEVEQAFFTAAEGPRRCVVRFDDYVRDLAGTMERIYAECLDGPVPPHVPREHPPRRRSGYLLDRSLGEAGIDEAALNVRLAGYRAWCAGGERQA